MISLEDNVLRDILKALVYLCPPDKLQCNVSVKTIEKTSGYSRRSVQAHLRILENMKIITTTRHTNQKTNRYTIVKNYKDFLNIHEKRCSRCNLLKSIDKFKKDKRRVGRGFKEYKCLCNECHNLHAKERYHNDLNYKARCVLRSRLFDALKGKYKSLHTIDLLGCDMETLKKHIESLFQEGMNWDNWTRGGWHIDHIRPCSSFDLSDPEQQKQCFHYTNLQPLWEPDNLRKGSKWQNTT